MGRDGMKRGERVLQKGKGGRKVKKGGVGA